MFDFEKVQNAFDITKEYLESVKEEEKEYKEKAEKANSDFVRGMYEGIAIAKGIEVYHLENIIKELHQ